jgi:hypothetical protein
MKNRFEYKTGNRMKMLVLAIFILLIPLSCHKINEGKADRSKVIPEKSFVSVLTDIYLADGMLVLPQIRNKFSHRDSISNYIDIIENHGYSYDDMNNTLEYYFFSKPKKLIKIYDQVLTKLSEMQSRYENEPAEPESDGRGMWTGKLSYDYPGPSGSDNPEFSIIVYPHSTFTFKFTLTVYPDDQSTNPCFTAWYSLADSAGSGKRTYLPSIRYLKDGLPHTYTIIKEVSVNSPVVLKGSLLDYENNPVKAELHARISDISFLFSTPVK